MITKKEFNILKEQYWTEEFKDKTILIKEDSKILVLVPISCHIFDFLYDKSKPKNYKYSTVEILPNQINYYGISGDKIQGAYIPPIFLLSSSKVVYIGWEDFEPHLSFICNVKDPFVMINDLQVILQENGKRLINDLKSADIPIKGLYHIAKYASSNFNLDLNSCNDTNIIKQVFKVSAKDLRLFLLSFDRCDINSFNMALFLKDLYKLPTETIIDYTLKLKALRIVNPHQFLFELTNKDKILFINYVLENKLDLRLIEFYRDYRDMRKQLSEICNIKDFPKYPKDPFKIPTLHDKIMAIQIREQQKIQAIKDEKKQEDYIKNFYAIYKALEYKNSEYSIVACKNLSDLYIEGSTLSHCVGSYVNSVSQGREGILFLRKNNDLNIPYFTINVVDKTVRQIHGKCNCNLPESLKPFVNEWAKKFDLDIENCSGIYCALR